ncbi:glycosyltransferase family 4 protein [Hymenobacter sp. HD11105]
MKVVLSHPTGNANVRAVLKGLGDAEALAEFHTTVATKGASFLLPLLPQGIQHEWLRRSFAIPSSQLRTHPFPEIARLFLPRIGLPAFTTPESGFASIDAVYQNLDNAVANRLTALAKSTTAVYAYEDGALATFTQAKKLGIKCIYDLPIAYWEYGRKLLNEEAIRLPKWAITLGGGITDSRDKLERKTRELELADIVIVPSQFVKDSLPSWTASKHIIVAPFGTPEAGSRKDQRKEYSTANPLRVLFVGSLGQRKGLGDLFAAIRLLNRSDVELVIMGTVLAPMAFYKSELPTFAYEQGRPHDQVLALMKSCDVFCLPSIIEGRALVMQEAMSQGLPLIITPNTGGSDLIKEKQTGFLVPIRSPEVIAEKLAWLLENPSEAYKMGQLAKDHATTYTWEKYSQHIVKCLKAHLN